VSLEQYYTEEEIGERLVAMLPCVAPENCIELSAGMGALLIPIIKQWPSIRISTCELDPENNRYLKNNFPGDHHEVDVISRKFDRTFKDKCTLFDLAVCNPPFSWRSNSDYEKASLKSFGTDWMCSWSKVRSEIIFIIQNLKLLRDTGHLAIILPELIVFSNYFSKFRKHLSTISSVVSISEVESGSFKGTEARTFILVLSKNRSNIPFSLTDKNSHISIHSQNEFHDWPSKSIRNRLFQLAEATFNLKRGTHSGKVLRESRLSYYHTSGFFTRNDLDVSGSSIEGKLIQAPSPLVASTGQVLINRVGTRALGKAVVVPKGQYVVSDCAYRLSVPNSIDPHDVVAFWHQQAEAIVQNARGTCAQYITKADILNYLALFLELQADKASTQSRFAIA
jgi:adenine-specific DNA-methyltransferase